jgi:hypothetical protein
MRRISNTLTARLLRSSRPHNLSTSRHDNFQQEYALTPASRQQPRQGDVSKQQPMRSIANRRRAVRWLLTFHSGSTARSRDHLTTPTTEDGDGTDGSCVVTGLALQNEDPSGTDSHFDENPR